MKMSLCCMRNSLLGLVLSLLANVAVADQFADGFQAATARDYAQAVEKWKPLAESGHPDAQLFLAMLHHSGSFGAVNEKEALKWYHKAAGNGNYTAQEYLAVGYKEGWFGLKKSSSKSQFWEKKLRAQE